MKIRVQARVANFGFSSYDLLEEQIIDDIYENLWEIVSIDSLYIPTRVGKKTTLILDANFNTEFKITQYLLTKQYYLDDENGRIELSFSVLFNEKFLNTKHVETIDNPFLKSNNVKNIQENDEAIVFNLKDKTNLEIIESLNDNKIYHKLYYSKDDVFAIGILK